jgi:hypothetical protein
VRGIEYAIARHRQEIGVLGPLKRFDRIHLGGALIRARRWARRSLRGTRLTVRRALGAGGLQTALADPVSQFIGMLG